MTGTDIIGAVQPLILALIGFWKWQHSQDLKEQAQAREQQMQFWKHLAATMDNQTVILQDIRNGLTVSQERFDAHDKTCQHNFAQIRTAQVKQPCELDPTQVEDLHDAAKTILRSRPV